MKELGERISHFTNLYFKENNRFAKDEKQTISEEHQVFLYHILDKMVENFATVGELLKQSEKQGYVFFKNSCYILLRGILSDVLMTWWIFTDDKSYPNENEMLNAKVKQVRRDHIKFHLSHLKKLEKSGLLKKEDKEFDINILNKEFGYLLSANEKIDDSLFLDIDSVGITAMLTDFTKKNEVFVDAYKTYFTFSKVEHTGGFTRMILERTYSSNNPMDEHIVHSIYIIETTLKVYIPFVLTDGNFFKELHNYKIVK